MPDQSQVTAVLKEYLQHHHPEFLRDHYDRPDGSFECQLKSPSRQFSIWVASYNCEITLGLQSPDGDSGCHTHFTAYDEDGFPEALEGMSALIADIMSGKMLYYHSTVHGFSWTTEMNKTLSGKQPNEAIIFFSWSGS